MTRHLVLLALLAPLGCATEAEMPALADAGPPDAGEPADAGPEPDAGLVPDAGLAPCDPTGIEAWQTTTALPEGAESFAALAVDGRLHVFGGWLGRNPSAQVLVSAIEPGGLGAWAAAQALPEPRQHHGVGGLEGRVCVFGGDDGRDASDKVSCAQRGPSGPTGWVEAAPLPAARTGHETVQVGDLVYVLGGVPSFRADPEPTVYVSRLDAEGAPASWRATTALPGRTFFAAATTDGRYVVLVGGVDGVVLDVVWVAEVGDDGELGAWMAQGRLPEPRYGATVWVEGGHLWLAGGVDGRGEPSDAVWVAAFEQGQVGAWRAVTPLPEPRFGHATVVLDDAVLVLGGWRDQMSLPRDTVYRRARCD